MKRKIVSGLLVAALLVGRLSVTVTANEYEETISSMQEEEAQTQETISNLEKQTKETQDAISSLQGQKTQTQSNISNLQNQSSALQSTINGYTNKLNDLSEEISDTEKALAEVSSEIIMLDNELQQARQKEKERHDLLMHRIKSTYESGGSKGLMRILLVSGSIQEFLTKFEYLNAILRYDTRVIQEYRALQEDIKQKTEVVEEKEAELDQYQAVLDDKHSELANLTDTVKGQLSTTNSNISSEKNKLADYDKQLADLDTKMKALEAQTAAAQAKLAQQIAKRLAKMKEDTSGSYAANATELEWLAATIQAEAGGESYTGKLAVGSVIMNRVKSSAFPNTITGVITQNMQFASYRSGKVELIIANGPNSTCVQAAQEVLDGARVGDYLFFMTQYYADYYRISEYTMIGNHAFFYSWITKDVDEDIEEGGDQPSEDPGQSEENENGGESEDNSQENTEENSGENTEENTEDDSGDNSDEIPTEDPDSGEDIIPTD